MEKKYEFLRKSANWKNLYFYQKAETLYQLTFVFCERFLNKHIDRTVDQMVQSARSVKQNIAEGLTDGQTSFEVEIRLLGIAQGSNRELLEDYQDYLKEHGLPEWAASPDAAAKERFNKLRAFCKQYSDDKDYRPFYLRWTDEEICNTAICLCHMVDRAMTTFIQKRDKEFVTEGGIKERMTAARLDMRGTQKQIIARLEAENAQLKAELASLRRELDALRNH